MRAINNKSHTAWPRSARYCSHHPAIRSDTQLKSSISHLSRGYYEKKTAYLHVEGTTLFYAFLECLQDSCSWKLSKKKQESSLLKLRISMSIEEVRTWEWWEWRRQEVTIWEWRRSGVTRITQDTDNLQTCCTKYHKVSLGEYPA